MLESYYSVAFGLQKNIKKLRFLAISQGWIIFGGRGEGGGRLGNAGKSLEWVLPKGNECFAASYSTKSLNSGKKRGAILKKGGVCEARNFFPFIGAVRIQDLL